MILFVPRFSGVHLFCSARQVHGCSGELSFYLGREGRGIFTKLESVFCCPRGGIAKAWKSRCTKPELHLLGFAMQMFWYWNWWAICTELLLSCRESFLGFVWGPREWPLAVVSEVPVGRRYPFKWPPSLPFRVCHFTTTTTTHTYTHTHTHTHTQHLQSSLWFWNPLFWRAYDLG